MTQVFAVDDNNDLYITTGGRLAISANLEAVMQSCEHAAKAQLSEMVLATNKGIPNFSVVWNGAPNLSQFEAALRSQLLNVTGVLEVSEVTSSVSNNVLSYSATIRTIYGEGVING